MYSEVENTRLLIFGLIKEIENHAENWAAVLKFRELPQQLSDAEALVELLATHAQHPHWLVRWCIADTLGEIRSIKAVESLDGLLEDGDQHVRHNALKSLVRQQPMSLDFVFHRLLICSTPKRRLYLDILERMGRGKQSAAVLKFLGQSLGYPNWMLANKAAELLWKIGTPETISYLCQGLVIPDVRKTCVVALGSLKAKAAVPFLKEVLSVPQIKRLVEWALKQA